MNDIQGLYLMYDYISEQTEQELINSVNAMPWCCDLSRRTQHYGYKYDYKTSTTPVKIPLFSHNYDRQVKDSIPSWYLENKEEQVIVNEYTPGQGISAHIDNPTLFGPEVISLSLGSDTVFQMEKDGVKHNIIVPRRSLLVMTGDSRYKWKHHIPPRKKDDGKERQTRISLTYRTMRHKN